MTEDTPEFAFPSTYRDLIGMSQVQRYGMTLRDYFAAQALIGICANQDNRVYGNATEFARSSYRLADAMLKARGQE